MGAGVRPRERNPMNIPGITSTYASNILASLMSRGLIRHLPNSNSNCAAGTEFSQQDLRKRNEHVVNALYIDFPRQCTTCGLRFNSQQLHSKHMDWHWHASKNKSRSKFNANCRRNIDSRKWLLNAEEWFRNTFREIDEQNTTKEKEKLLVTPSGESFQGGGNCFVSNSEAAEVEASAPLPRVPADENQTSCALCGEGFEELFDDELDQWVYKGVIFMDDHSNSQTPNSQWNISTKPKLVHAKCV